MLVVVFSDEDVFIVAGIVLLVSDDVGHVAGTATHKYTTQQISISRRINSLAELSVVSMQLKLTPSSTYMTCGSSGGGSFCLTRGGAGRALLGRAKRRLHAKSQHKQSLQFESCTSMYGN